MSEYRSMYREGRCKVCNKIADLRAEVCWECADKVDGKPLGHGAHLLWEKDNPTNNWIYTESLQ